MTSLAPRSPSPVGGSLPQTGLEKETAGTSRQALWDLSLRHSAAGSHVWNCHAPGTEDVLWNTLCWYMKHLNCRP